MKPELLRSMVLVLIASFVGSFGAVFLKVGAGRVNRSPLSFVNGPLALGVALYLGSSGLFLLGIKNGDLSVLYPMVSLGYIWTLVWSKIFFKEPFTRNKCVGLGLILLGVFFVGLGS